MITGKLTAKGRTTVPVAARRALGLTEGDRLGWVVGDGRATVSRLARPDPADPFQAFEEWAGEADARAYARL